MMHITSFTAALFLIASLLTVGCSKGDEATTSAENTEVAVETQSSVETKIQPPPDPKFDELFRLAFGKSAPVSIEAPADTRDGTYVYKPVKILRQGPLSIMLSEATASDCHGCFGKLAIHYFSDEAERPKLLGAWFDLVGGNGWGKPPDWLVRQDLMDEPVLEVRTGFANSGYDCEWVSLVELTPSKPIPRLSHIVAAYDNSGARDDTLGMKESYWETTSSTIRPRGAGQFVIVYEGSRAAMVTYTKKDGRYIADRRTPISNCNG